MPIPNPHNPNEMDYIDYSIVNKTVMNPDYLFSCETMRLQKMDLSLEIEPNDEENIYFVAKLSDTKIKAKTSREQFEQLMSDLAHKTENKNKRIEQTDLFRNTLGEAIDLHIEGQKQVGNLYFKIGNKAFVGGLGIIWDREKNEDIGIFESLEIEVKDSGSNRYIVHDLTLPIGNDKTILSNLERYEFIFYNLDEKLLYTLSASAQGSTSFPSELASHSLQLNAASLYLDKIVDLSEVDLIAKAVESRNNLKSVESNDPFYADYKDTFASDRHAILRLSKQKAEQEKVQSIFSDIEF